MRTSLLLLALLIPSTLAWAMPLPCGTLYMMSQGRPTRDRPDADAYIESDTYPIRVHYLYGAEDLAEVTLEAAELSWQMQVEDWGWAAPDGDDGLGGSDALDYYLADTEFGGYASPDDWWETGSQAHCVGHMVINRHMDADSVRITVPHEFNHILQMWTDCAEDPQLFEASAVFAQDWVYPEYGSAWYFAAGYQDVWYHSLDYYDYAQPPQYGSFIFLQYIAERFDDGTPTSTREIWDDSTQGNFGNTNTWMAALERFLEPRWPADMPQPHKDELYTELAWQEFSEYRYFLGDNWIDGYLDHGTPDSAFAGIELPLAGTASLASLEQGPVDIEIDHAMAELSSGAIEIRHPQEGWVVHADLLADGGAERWALTLVSVDEGEDAVLERVVGDIEEGEAHVSTEVLADVDTIVAVVAQVGDGTLDPTQDDWQGTDADVQIWVEGYEGDDDDAADDDDDAADDDDASGLPMADDDDDEDGCACSQRSASGGPSVVALVLLVAAFRRRIM